MPPPTILNPFRSNFLKLQTQTNIQSLLCELGVFMQAAPSLFCFVIILVHQTSLPIHCLMLGPSMLRLTIILCMTYRVAAKTLNIQFFSSKDHLANILTKPLVSTRFKSLNFNLNVCSLTLPLWGHIRDYLPYAFDRHQQVNKFKHAKDQEISTDGIQPTVG